MSLISIHAPLAGCDDPAAFLNLRHHISIHAPLAGCDLIKCSSVNPRCISIHAPLAGCDLAPVRYAHGQSYFNPRTPCGVRHGHYHRERAGCGISIHAPLAGCDVLRKAHRAGQHGISIHAPLAGCDSTVSKYETKSSYFNPRTPCGVRRMITSKRNPHRDFNPRTPCGVRQGIRRYRLWHVYFNPRTPCGVRHTRLPVRARPGAFQSTHPLRGATYLSAWACS